MLAALLLAALPLAGGCSRGDGARYAEHNASPAGDGASSGASTTITTLRVWAHAGQEAERATLQRQVEAFNARYAAGTAAGQGTGREEATKTTGPATGHATTPAPGHRPAARVELTLLPEGSYNAQVQAAALAGDLPEVLELDGPFLYNYVWQQHLLPLDDLLPAATRQRLIRSIVEQGTYHGHLYAAGTFDSGLGLFGRRSLLAAAGARIPATPAEAWSADEFDRVLAALAARDPDGQVLDLKLNYRGEWYTYAFAPLLWSAGGGLIARPDYSHAAGVLDGPASVGALRRVQRWIRDGRVDPNVDDHAFAGGRVALSWVGHWEYRHYREMFGDDLVLLPLPDFGGGTRTGQGSWCWSITRRCAQPEAAARFVDFLLEDEQVLAMCDANAAVPATTTALARSPLYAPGGPLHLFAAQLTGGFAVPRPRTPAYPVITSVFQRAFADIQDGAGVQATLARAAVEIDQDIRDNEGYRAAR